MAALRLAAALPGLLLVLAALRSAVRTFVLPRSARDGVVRAVLLAARLVFAARVRFARDYAARDFVMALYAPFAVLALTACWVVMVGAGYAVVYWSLGDAFGRAVVVSGSTLLTLGFEKPNGPVATAVAFTEGGIGLTLVALLVSYLPAMYAAFARRESMVTLLEIRAGSPPDPVALLVHAHEVGGLDAIDAQWTEWQRWFAELEESHTSLGVLAFFRSPQPHRSWVTAAGAALDAVSLTGAVLRPGPSARERLTLRAGAFALRRIAEFLGLPVDEHPDPRAPVSVRRHEFHEACARLAAGGLAVADEEQAWADFVASRAQYDAVLLALAALTMAPDAPWSGDRAQHVRSRLEPGGSDGVDPLAGPEPVTDDDRDAAVPAARPRAPDPTSLDGRGDGTRAAAGGRGHDSDGAPDR